METFMLRKWILLILVVSGATIPLKANDVVTAGGLSVAATSVKRGKANVDQAKSEVSGGKEVTSGADLYGAIPGEAKRSEIVGGLVKSYSGPVDIVCAKDTYVCIVTFKK
jgi:hypothetical protein